MENSKYKIRITNYAKLKTNDDFYIQSIYNLVDFKNKTLNDMKDFESPTLIHATEVLKAEYFKLENQLNKSFSFYNSTKNKTEVTSFQFKLKELSNTKIEVEQIFVIDDKNIEKYTTTYDIIKEKVIIKNKNKTIYDKIIQKLRRNKRI